MSETPGRDGWPRDAKLVALVSAAHLTSHFYQLVLPPLFPLLTTVFGVGYTELGLLATLTYATSGVMQTPAGILVDRLGSARVLIGGLGIYSAAILCMGLVPGFWWLAPLAVVAGVGNCVFHPADYAIMTAKVGPRRLGRAFGAHTLAGNIGWVAAPVTVLALSSAFGWRGALVILGGAGLLLTLYLLSQAAVLRADPATPRRTGPAAPRPSNIAGALLSLPILLCFAYFALLAISQVGLQTFLPSTLVAAFALSLESANFLLTALLLASALGIVAGGIVADRFRRHELIVAVGLGVAAAASLAFLSGPLPLPALMLCAVIAGFAMGGTTPARDMLVRAAAPPGETGKVFGFVYSGLDLGGTVTPLLLGYLLDHELPRLVFAVSAVALFLAIGSAWVVGGDRVRRRRRKGDATAPAE